MMPSVLWRHLYLEHSQSVQYFSQQFYFTTCQVLNIIAVYGNSVQVQQASVFRHQTLVFHFSTYRPNSCKLCTVTCQFNLMRESTAVIVASVVETTWRPGSSSSTTLSRTWANFLHQTCIVGLVNTCHHWTGRFSDWMAFVLSPYAHSKWITEDCYLWGGGSTEAGGLSHALPTYDPQDTLAWPRDETHCSAMWWDLMTTRQPTAHYHRSQQQELATALVLVGGDSQDVCAIHGSSRPAMVHPSAFVLNGLRLVVVATPGWCNGPLLSTRSDDFDVTFGMISTATLPYLMFINDVTVTSS